MDIDCNKLFKIWKKICNDSKKKIIDAWDSGSWSSYTETIMGPQNPNSILGKLKDEIHLSIYQEYYSCDAIFFNEDKCLKKEEIQDFLSDEVINAPSPFNQCWVKEIKIHLEHENNIKNSWQEIMQFCVIPGKINVLIAYPNHAEEKIAINCYKNILKV